MIRVNHESTLLSIAGANLKGLKLIHGEIVKAEVVNILSSGNIMLKIKGVFIPVKSEIPFETGQKLTLQVKGTMGGDILKLQLMNDEIGEKTFEYLKAKLEPILHGLERIGDSKKGTDRFERLTHQLLKTIHDNPSLLPLDIKSRLVEILLRKLKLNRGGMSEGLDLLIRKGIGLKEIKSLIGQSGEGLLKELLESSGILFETRMKMALDSKNLEKELSLLLKDDIKANLLRLAEREPANKMVNSLIRDIEAFQALSKITDSFYTFLPLIWNGLKDADILFKKGSDKKEEAPFSCRINLNLERYGRVTVTIILNGKNLFVSFMIEDAGFRKAVEDNRDLLQRSFADRGLNLKAVNVMELNAETLWTDISEGIDIKV